MESAEEKIIAAAQACIEKYGIEKTTIRQIGKEAGVNSASINYYFRSKEALLQRVIDTALGNIFNINLYTDSIGQPIKQRFASILEGTLASMVKSPNMSKAFFYELFNDNNYDSPVVKKCSAFLAGLETKLNKEYPYSAGPEIGAAVMQASSATFLFFGLFPKFFKNNPEIDLSDEHIRHAYVQTLVDKLFQA